MHALVSALLCRATLAAAAALQSTPAPTEANSSAAQQQLADAIDAALGKAWAEPKLAPVVPVDDAHWLRRVSVDLRATIPTSDEVAKFLADASPDKRSRKVDEYLVDHHFAENFCALWTNVLLASAGKNEDRMGRRLHPWLEEQFDKGVSFLSITRDLVASSGAAVEPGALSYALSYWDTVETFSGMTARSFLGLQIQCAQCHDHPFDHWKRDDFNRFTGLFFDMRADNVEGERRDLPLFRVGDRGAETYLCDQLRYVVGEAGKQRGDDSMAGGGMHEMQSSAMQPTSGPSGAPQDLSAVKELIAACEKAPPGASPLRDYDADPQKFADLMTRLPPAAHDVVQKYHDRRALFGEAGFLDGKPYEPKEGRTKREALADWMLSPDNPWFGRAVANRMWGHLFGKGLVEPVDDLTGSKDQVLPELLETIGRQFVARGGDLRLVVGAIARTKAYALGNARTADSAERDHTERWFAAHPIRSLTSEQMANALARATDNAFDDDVRTRNNRAAQRAHKHEMINLTPNFGKTGIDRADPFAASIPKELLLMNGGFRIGEQRRRRMLDELRDSKRPDSARLETLFLSTVGRPAVADEATRLVALVEGTKSGPMQGIDDLAWALLNSTEFHTNH